MSQGVAAGARLDRLLISSFHYRIFWLIAAGMFFDVSRAKAATVSSTNLAPRDPNPFG
jgi:hypothetical protein